jgi:pilus assembly protein FimV
MLIGNADNIAMTDWLPWHILTHDKETVMHLALMATDPLGKSGHAIWLLIALLLPSWAQAIGLSGIRVHSLLNQPFKAEVELISREPISVDSVHVSLASAEDFARVGYERPFLLSQLRFEPVTLDDGRTLIRIHSKVSIKEPYLKFLLEISRQQGRIVRAYSVMLEPPVSHRRPVVEVAKAAKKPPLEGVQAAQASVPASAAKPSPTVRHARPSALSVNAFPLTYGPVGPGETLWSIASAARHPGASVEQMLMAFYRNNPQAFPSAHISDLKAGEMLRIPSKEELFLLNKSQARLAFEDQQKR